MEKTKMNMTGVKVRHKVFGDGVVSRSSADTVTVSFPSGSKSFIFPDAFLNFLQAEDESVKQNIELLIRRREEERRINSRREQERHARLWRIKNYTVTANSHAVFNVPPEQISEVCGEYTVSTGEYLSGSRKGEARVASRLKPNSLCLITSLDKGEKEGQRRIIAAFMVREDFFGEDCLNGQIEAHPQYRLERQGQSPMLFWDYAGDGSAPRWGSAAFKYCTAGVISRILSDWSAKLSGAEFDEAMEFYSYFCKLNHLSPISVKNHETDKAAIG